MTPSYSSAELHTLLPGPNGGHACLTLYDVCPHTTHPPPSHLTEPYLHCDLPPLSSPRALGRNNEEEREIHEITRTTLSHHPSDTLSTARLARLVLSKHSPVLRHIRDSTQPIRFILKPPNLSTPVTNPPTIYLVTFSTDRTPSTRSFAQLLNTHLPLRIPLLYTVDARAFLVPPAQVCEVYSGVAPPVQDAVLRDAGARREIRGAVDELVRFACANGATGREVGLAVCCTAGTHRSVAIAELVALGVRNEVRKVGSREGVKVVVRHVHRVRGIKDPY